MTDKKEFDPFDFCDDDWIEAVVEVAEELEQEIESSSNMAVSDSRRPPAAPLSDGTTSWPGNGREDLKTGRRTR